MPPAKYAVESNMGEQVQVLPISNITELWWHHSTKGPEDQVTGSILAEGGGQSLIR